MVMALAALTAAGGSAQERHWSVGSSAQVDLWYHGLAVVGFQGFGAVPLYEPGYAAAVGAAKRAAGLSPTLLDNRAPALLDAFRQDSIFEVLHFVPVYFGATSRVEMLDALDAVAHDPKRAPDRVVPGARPGTVILARLLTTAEERRVLADFVAALRDEWSRFFRAYRAESLLPDLDRRVAATRRRLGGSVEPALGPFLERWHLASGVVLLSPAVGLDGRFFDGDPRSDRDNIVVVGTGGPPDEGQEALRVVREWCYPAVRKATEESSPPDRTAAEAESGRAAVRCGGLLLERRRPEDAADYRRVFLDAGAEPTAANLARTFPIPAFLESGLERLLQR